MNTPDSLSARLADIEDRFLRYVKIDTQSRADSTEVPSTRCQLDLLNLLRDELIEMGALDVVITDYACLMATFPSPQPEAGLPTVAFLAHVDTAPAFRATGVRPIVHRNYQGQPIALPDDPTQILSTDDCPALLTQIGHDLVTASGTTLLGADDKAGVAIIMSLCRSLVEHPDRLRGAVRVCFTPDEEIGQGAKRLQLADLAADVAYTLDGGAVGEINYETFSADAAVVRIQGVSIHPGDAKDKLVNAVQLAARLAEMLPKSSRTPETTSGRQGFIHLTELRGTPAEAELHFILRDFELDGLTSHGELLTSAANYLQAAEPRAKVECTIRPQYRNMRYWLENDMSPATKAIEAITLSGLTPRSEPIRGGTDGSIITEMGLPTPNLFTGMHNVHGPLEWVSIQDMSRAVDVCSKLLELWAVRGTSSA